MAPVIGIDLGTTNTVVAVVRDGHASAIADESGRTLIPSVVSFHANGTVLVGEPARARRLVDPTHTIYSVKRLIGRSYDSDEVQRARARFPFEMREGPGQAALVVARGETYTLPEISAFVLRKARSVAEAHLGTPVERAVITVPANFNDLQRAATKVAGRVAGLEVLRILNEPTAAALAYGLGKSGSGRLAVYDFGGGTFDITLLDLSDNVFEVLATAGNSFLGGDDIDVAIAERMASECVVRYRYDPRESPNGLELLRAAAERLKRALSQELHAEVEIEELSRLSGGRVTGFRYRMTRAEFDRLATPIVDRTFEVCAEALRLARASVEDFDDVLLVGGSTRIPLVRERVEAFFGRPPLAHISPDEVVALGAAIQANALAGTARRQGTIPLPPAAARRAPTVAGPGPGKDPPAAARAPRAKTLLGVPAPAGAPPVPPAPPAQDPTSVSVATPPAAPRQAEQRPAAPPPAEAPPAAARQVEQRPAAARPREAPKPPPAAPLQPPALQHTLPMEAAPPQQTLPLQAITMPEHGAAGPSQPNAPPDRAAPRVESTAFTLSNEDIEEILPPPPAPPLPDAGEDEITRRALTAPGGVREEPTQPLRPEPGVIPRAPQPAPWTLPIPAAVAPQPAPAPPLLVDVTPLSLRVETVSGFCDVVIARNTSVPCEQTREFVTASDDQTSVRVRVAQGESRVFDENTLLGEVELSGLPPLPRGSVRIAVTFALDTNGMLEVSAKDVRTGRATRASLKLIGVPEPSEIAMMLDRQSARLTL